MLRPDGHTQVTDQDVSASFVARIWLEQGGGRAPRWRGHVEHVQSGKKEYFDTLASLQGFLASVTGIPGPDRDLAGTPVPPPQARQTPGIEKRKGK